MQQGAEAGIMTTTSKIILCPTEFSPSPVKAFLTGTQHYSRKAGLIAFTVTGPLSCNQWPIATANFQPFSTIVEILLSQTFRLRFVTEYGFSATSMPNLAKTHGTDVIVNDSKGIRNIRKQPAGKHDRNAPAPFAITGNAYEQRE